MIESLNKRQIAFFLATIIFPIEYLLVSTLLVVTILLPFLSGYIGLSLLLVLVLYALVLASYVMEKYQRFEYRSDEWLKTHWIFGWTELLFAIVLFITGAISFFVLTSDSNIRLALAAWYAAFLAGLPLFYQRMKNMLGMNYKSIGLPSLNGAVVFAELSILHLKKERIKGLDYLNKSLWILRQNLWEDGKSLRNLEETIRVIDLLESITPNKKPPFKQLCFLAARLVELPSYDGIVNALDDFQKSQEFEWTHAFLDLPRKTQNQSLASIFEKYLVSIALVLVTLLAALPESYRTQVVDFFSKLQWMQIIGLVIVVFLGYQFLSLHGKLQRLIVGLSDVKEVIRIHESNNLAKPTQSAILFPKPLNIRLADVLFFSMRKNLMLFKELDNGNIHYSIFIRDSLIDFHKTLEDQHKHIPLLEMEFDWENAMTRTIEEVRRNWRSILKIGRTDDPRLSDLEVQFVSFETFMELFSPLVKGVKWNIDEKFLRRLEREMTCSSLGELTGSGLTIGTGSGLFVLSNGIECVLFDVGKMSKIIERSFELSITRVRLWKPMPRSILFYVKLRLFVLNNSAIKYLRKL